MSNLNLKNFWQSTKHDKYLLAALLLGLILRGSNPTFGSPTLFVSNDEAAAHLSAFNMIASKTPVSIANYTPLGAYIQIPFLVAGFLLMKIAGLVSNAGDFELFVLTHQGYFLYIPRIISAFFGTLTILVTYKLTWALFKNSKTAIIAAFLAAVSFNLVHISHFGKPWAPALFFFTLAVYLSIKKSAFLSWVAVGLSYGFHQVGILAIPLIFLLNIPPFSLSKKGVLISNVKGILVMILMIVLFSFLTLQKGLIESIRQDQSFLKMGKLAADFITGDTDIIQSALRTVKNNLLSYFSISLLVTDFVIFLFSIIGMILAFKKDKLTHMLVLYSLSYFLFAVLFFHPLLRYLLPVLLISIPFAAYGLEKIFPMRLVLVTVLIVSSINSIWWNYLYLKTPTFIQARSWINQNISPDIPIAYIGGRYQTFVPNKKAIIETQKVNANYFKSLFPHLGEKNSDNVRSIIYTINFEGKSKLDQLTNATNGYPAAYVIDVYFDPKESIYSQNQGYFDNPVHFAPSGKTVYPPDPLFDPRLSFQFPTSMIEFSMYSLERTGPYIDILKFKKFNTIH